MCDYQAKYPQHLKTHKDAIHEGKKHECNICGHKASRKDYLKSHIQVHIGQELLECTFCDKIFKHRNGLKYHIKKVHEGLRYNCNMCDTSYTSKGALVTHIKAVHLKEKKFPCKQCNFKSSREDVLTRHNENRHQLIKVACNKCGKTFKKWSLSNHIRIFHSGKLEETNFVHINSNAKVI